MRSAREIGSACVAVIDARLAVVVALVPKGVVDVDLVAGGRVREDVVTHRVRDGAVELDLVVVELNVRPAAAAVDGEAGVLAWLGLGSGSGLGLGLGLGLGSGLGLGLGF